MSEQDDKNGEEKPKLNAHDEIQDGGAGGNGKPAPAEGEAADLGWDGDSATAQVTRDDVETADQPPLTPQPVEIPPVTPEPVAETEAPVETLEPVEARAAMETLAPVETPAPIDTLEPVATPPVTPAGQAEAGGGGPEPVAAGEAEAPVQTPQPLVEAEEHVAEIPAPAPQPAPEEAVVETPPPLPQAPGYTEVPDSELTAATAAAEPLQPVVSGSADAMPDGLVPTEREADEWARLVQLYEHEAEAAEQPRRKAELYYEIGRLWEYRLGAQKQAAEAYEKSFHADEAYLPTIRAARRAFADVHQWQAVVELIDAEIGHLEESSAISLLLLEKARIISERLEKPEDAAAAYEAAAALDPSNLVALAQRLDRARAAGDREAAIAACRAIAEAAIEPSLKAYHLFEAAVLTGEDLENREQALELFRQSLLVEPGNANTIKALRRLLAQFERWDDLLTLYASEIRLAEENEEKALLFYQSARVCRERIDDSDRAVQFLKQAADLSPHNLLVLNELEKVCGTSQRWQDLADAYERLVQVTGDAHQQVALFFKLGLLWEERLFDEEQAIKAYSRIRQINPTYLPALQSLGKLFAKNQRWSDQIEMILAEASATTESRQAANRFFKAGEIYEEHVQDEEKAIEMYRLVLERVPTHLPALKALGSLYNKHQRWPDLVALYEGELRVTRDRAQIVHLLEKLGTIYDEKLSDKDKAIATYQRILEEAPGYLPAVRLLARIYFQAGRWEDLIKINEMEASIVEDQNQVVALYHKNGEIYEEKLGDKDTAIEYYKKVVALQPTYLPTLSALGRLYLQRGQWEELINMYYQEIEVTQSQEVIVSLLFKIGELWEEKLVQEEKAIEAFLRVVGIDRTYLPALEALGRIYTKRREWNKRIDIYERELEVTSDERQRIFLLFKIGEIYEEKQGDVEQAIATYIKALQIDPGYVPALKSLIRLYTAAERWEDLVQAYSAELSSTSSASRKVALLQTLAEIHERRLDHANNALTCYEQILSIEPNHLATLRILEQVYRRQEVWDKLYAVLQRLVETVEEREARISLLMEMAELTETRLPNIAATGEHYLKVLEIEPLHPGALDALESLYRRAGMWDGLTEVLGRKRQIAPDPTTKVVLCHQLGDLWESQQGGLDQAVAAYREGLQADPAYLPTLKALKRIFTGHERWPELIEVLSAEAEAALSKQQSVSSLFQIAFIYMTKIGDTEQGKKFLFRTLELDPRHQDAFAQLERMLMEQQSYEELATLYETRAEGVSVPAELAALHERTAKIYEQQLQQPDKAVAAFKRALEVEPRHAATLLALGELQFAAGQWEEAAEYLRRTAELGGEPQALVPVYYKLGLIYDEKRPDPAQAIHYFQAILAFEPGNLAALEKLSAQFLKNQDWRNALDTINTLISNETDRERLITHYLNLAVVYETGFGDTNNAAVCCQRALEVEPASQAAIQHLGGLLKRLERWADLVDAYERFIAALPEDKRQIALPLRQELGQLYLDKLGNEEKATTQYRQMTEVDPLNAEARMILANLLARSPQRYGEATVEFRQVVAQNPANFEALHQLARIYMETQAEDRALMVCSLLRYFRVADDLETDYLRQRRAEATREPSAPLGEEDRETLLVHPHERGVLRKVARVFGEALPRAHPQDLGQLYGVGRSNRVSPRANDPIRRIADTIAPQLGLAGYEAYKADRLPHTVEAIAADPPALVLSPELERRTKPEQRFQVARNLALLANRGSLFLRIGPDATKQLFAAAVRTIDPGFAPAGVDAAPLDDLAKKLNKGMSRKARKALEPLAPTLANQFPQLDFESYVASLDASADRAGLIYCGDIAVAIGVTIQEDERLKDVRVAESGEMESPLANSPRLSQLVGFALGDEFYLLRERLGLSAK